MSTTTQSTLADVTASDATLRRFLHGLPGVDQVVCLAYLTVFTTTIRDACQEFEAKASPPAAIAGSPAP